MQAGSPYDEIGLLRRTGRGDVLAFRELFDHHRNRVFFIARQMLHSDTAAEDAVQEIFLKIWVHNRRLGTVDNFTAYLNTVTRNHIYNVIRRRAIEEKALGMLARPEVSEVTDDTVAFHELQRVLQQASATLSVQQRKVFEMSRLEGKKHEQIATEMGLSKETVKKYLANALEKLHRYLVQQGRGLFL
ncbi:RNA polymerase sigma-70 factor [Sediminibacterium soli]|uniref:RNA polymerase sigma-70 factor n=1 Tax=Sediminibacterium soli TaxID=2698829 RepID=UPI00137B577F|nr:RNA polymerase sigma-70 factor [Sediminibacterium soli]NCI46470.1 RNA polymerase sigma-70 factor [Sediminibacterium soli]